MAFHYNITNQGAIHFVTFTVHQWVDVFTRSLYVDILINALIYCQKNKGLQVYAWVIMSNHCHLIVSAKNNNLSDIIRDLKKFTAKEIVTAIQNNQKESRKNWLLLLLCKDNKIWFWEEGYHGEEIYSKPFYETKVKYIHFNPVRAGIVEKEEEYIICSCAAFYGLNNSKIELELY
jgi:putative transposase